MNAAVIIPTWNNAPLTVRCLESLAKFTENYRLVWIDNGSRPVEKAMVEEAIDRLGIFYKSLMNEKNLGFSKAVNQGLKIALAGNYDPIVLLNNDVTLTAGWLDKLRAALIFDHKLGIVGSIHEKGAAQGYRRFMSSVKFHGSGPAEFFNRLPLTIQKTSMSVPFSCVAIRREVIQEVGFLDEAFSPCLGEDNDYCDRIRIAGWNLAFVLNCFTWHTHRATVNNLPDHEAIKHRNEHLLREKRMARLHGIGLERKK